MSNRAIVLAIKGVISELPPEEQATATTAYGELKAVLDKHGAAGLMALALLGAELSEE